MNTAIQNRNPLKWNSLPRLALGFCLLAVASLAQSPTPRPLTPPADDAEVFFSFFTFHDDFSRWLDQRNAADPAGISKRTQAAARLFGVSESELPKISVVTRSVAAQLTALRAEVQGYIDQQSASRQPTTRDAFQQFATRRQQIVSSGVQQLSTSLSPVGWTALHAYINGPHRRGINAPLPPVPPPRVAVPPLPSFPKPPTSPPPPLPSTPPPVPRIP